MNLDKGICWKVVARLVREAWREIRSLALFSYRHFANGRMLKALQA